MEDETKAGPPIRQLLRRLTRQHRLEGAHHLGVLHRHGSRGGNRVQVRERVAHHLQLRPIHVAPELALELLGGRPERRLEREVDRLLCIEQLQKGSELSAALWRTDQR